VEAQTEKGFGAIAARILAGEMPNDAETEIIRRLEHPYRDAASLIASEPLIAQAIRNIKIGEQEMKNLDDLFAFVPFSVG
jgi:hypothetical protein